ncbi:MULTISPECIES: hypothetical protein [unclassified Streptomyces]|uniref:hypothetical protein n=1 Tax=unclassified Streptomyces TaxID=2593676 RepID=UPI003818B16A
MSSGRATADRRPSSATSRYATSCGEPSHVLTAIGFTRDQARATLRLGIGRTTTDTEIDQAADLIAHTAHTLMPPTN